MSTGHTFTICTPRRGRGEGESLLRHGQFIGSAFVDAVDTIQELLHINVEFNLDPIVPEHRNLLDDVAADHFLDLHRLSSKILDQDTIRLNSAFISSILEFPSFSSAVRVVIRSLVDSTFCRVSSSISVSTSCGMALFPWIAFSTSDLRDSY